jgi:hypothetical protein
MEMLAWSGGDEPFLTAPAVDRVGRVTLGRYGGAGGKNEDGAMIWSGPDWTLAAILDGHAGSESVDVVLALLGEAAPNLEPLCASGAIVPLQQELIRLLTAPETSRRMAEVRGETACLIAYHRGPHLLWLQIGDNTLYLLHPELMRLGQYALTTRNFFEWIGERSSLTGSVPYFSIGIRQLRQGRNDIVLVTDGIQEMPGTPFEPPLAFAAAFNAGADPVGRMLGQAQAAAVRDSCTMVAWSVDNPEPGLVPSG